MRVRFGEMISGDFTILRSLASDSDVSDQDLEEVIYEFWFDDKYGTPTMHDEAANNLFSQYLLTGTEPDDSIHTRLRTQLQSGG